MTQKKLLKIGEIAKKTGVTLRTIRYYHELGLIQPVERTAGNFRLYDENAITIIRLISSLKKLDFSLDEIKTLLLCNEKSDESYLKTIKRTKNILGKKKEKVEEKLTYYQGLSDEIDNSLKMIEECIACRRNRGEQAPCKPGCDNSSIHIRL